MIQSARGSARPQPTPVGSSPSNWTRARYTRGAHHRDPFDRTLTAQAIIEGMTLASRDASIALYDVDILKV